MPALNGYEPSETKDFDGVTPSLHGELVSTLASTGSPVIFHEVIRDYFDSKLGLADTAYGKYVNRIIRHELLHSFVGPHEQGLPGADEEIMGEKIAIEVEPVDLSKAQIAALASRAKPKWF